MTKRFKNKKIFVLESDDIVGAEFLNAVEDYPPSLNIRTKSEVKVLYLDALIDMQKCSFLKSNDE